MEASFQNPPRCSHEASGKCCTADPGSLVWQNWKKNMEQKIITHHHLMLYLKKKQLGVLIRQGLPFSEGANQSHFFPS